MADDIKLVFGVEQGGLLKAITNTEALEKKVKKLSAAYANDSVSYGRYSRAINKLAKATNRSKKELLDYGTALRADEKATKKAKAETKAFAKARCKVIRWPARLCAVPEIIGGSASFEPVAMMVSPSRAMSKCSAV